MCGHVWWQMGQANWAHYLDMGMMYDAGGVFMQGPKIKCRAFVVEGPGCILSCWSQLCCAWFIFAQGICQHSVFNVISSFSGRLPSWPVLSSLLLFSAFASHFRCQG